MVTLIIEHPFYSKEIGLGKSIYVPFPIDDEETEEGVLGELFS